MATFCAIVWKFGLLFSRTSGRTGSKLMNEWSSSSSAFLSLELFHIFYFFIFCRTTKSLARERLKKQSRIFHNYPISFYFINFFQISHQRIYRKENKILKKAVAIQENRYPIHYLADLLSLYFKLQNSFLYMQAPRHGQPEQQPAVRSWSGGGKDSLAARNEQESFWAYQYFARGSHALPQQLSSATTGCVLACMHIHTYIHIYTYIRISPIYLYTIHPFIQSIYNPPQSTRSAFTDSKWKLLWLSRSRIRKWFDFGIDEILYNSFLYLCSILK